VRKALSVAPIARTKPLVTLGRIQPFSVSSLVTSRSLVASCTVTSPPHLNAIGAVLQFYWP
jgi:hypothetical protein